MNYLNKKNIMMKNNLLLLFICATFLIANHSESYALTTLQNPNNSILIPGSSGYSITISSGSVLTNTGVDNLSVAGNWTNKGGTFSGGTGTVTLNSTSAQTIGGSAPTAFNNLTLGGSNIKTISSATVNGILSMEGTATVTNAPTYGSAATLQYKGAAAQTTGAELPSLFSGTGGVIINNLSGVTLGNSTAIAPSNKSQYKIPGSPANELKILSGALTLNPDINLTVGGNTTFGSAECLIIKSDATGSGSFIDNGTFNGTGTANVEKFIATNTYGRAVATPVDNAETSAFNSNPVKYYDPLTTDWLDFTTGNMEKMKGYYTLFSSDGTLAFNNGHLFTGTQTYTDLWRTGTGAGSNHGWNFIGNPYPSAINWDDVVTLNGGSVDFLSNTKLVNSVYISDGNGGYNSYVNGVGTPDNLIRIIPSATSFWVHVSSAYINAGAPIAGATLSFNNTVRVHGNTISSKATSALNIIRLTLSNTNFTDGLVVRLEGAATSLFDSEYDAFKMPADNLSYPQIYSIAGNIDFLSINSIPDDLSQPVAVPLGFSDASGNLLTINAFDFSNIDPNVDIYLEDILENQMIDLRIQPSYSFNTLLNEDNNRFVLHLGHLSTNINSQNNTTNSTIYAYENHIYISQIESPTLCVIYNILGQQVNRAELSMGSLQKVDVNLPTGSYIITLISTGRTITQKVIIN